MEWGRDRGRGRGGGWGGERLVGEWGEWEVRELEREGEREGRGAVIIEFRLIRNGEGSRPTIICNLHCIQCYPKYNEVITHTM